MFEDDRGILFILSGPSGVGKGTVREKLFEEELEAGNLVYLEVEVQGALRVKESFSGGVFIFLSPPSLDIQKNRIVSRGTESEELVRNRLIEARKELNMMHNYDYVVVNDQIDNAVKKVKSIIISEHCKRERVEKQYKNIIKDDDINVRTID